MQNTRIILKGDYSVKAIIHIVIENLILCKWQIFKNNPRGNVLILRSLWISLFLPTLILLILLLFKYLLSDSSANSVYTFFNKNDSLEMKEYIFNFRFFKSYLLPWLGLNLIIYSNLWKDYHTKWSYCSALYNEIAKQSCDKVRRNLISNFAIDLLFLDMWAHRSFYGSFRTSVEDAIEHKYSSCTECQIERLNRGEFTENEIAKILEQYQSDLTDGKFELNYECKCCKEKLSDFLIG